MTVDEVVETLTQDDRWQDLLRRLGSEEAVFCAHCVQRRNAFIAWVRERAAQIVQRHELDLAEEREACARVCLDVGEGTDDDAEARGALACADAIRERGLEVK